MNPARKKDDKQANRHGNIWDRKRQKYKTFANQICCPKNKKNTTDEQQMHSYYLPWDYWPSSVSLKNNNFYTNYPTPLPHATLTIGAAGASP